MNLREAGPDDVAAVRDVHEAAIRGLGPAAYDDEQVEAWAAGCESAEYGDITDPESRFVVVETDDGDVVGFGCMRFDPGEEYEIDADAEVTGMYVHPDVAGDGVGTAILADLEDAAADRGGELVVLTASLNAVDFYEHRGYERALSMDHEFSAAESTGVTGTVVVMRKTL